MWPTQWDIMRHFFSVRAAGGSHGRQRGRGFLAVLVELIINCAVPTPHRSGAVVNSPPIQPAACGMAAPLLSMGSANSRSIAHSRCHEACPQCAHNVKTDNACTSGAAAVHLRQGKKRSWIYTAERGRIQQRNVRPRICTVTTGEQRT